MHVLKTETSSLQFYHYIYHVHLLPTGQVDKMRSHGGRRVYNYWDYIIQYNDRLTTMKRRKEVSWKCGQQEILGMTLIGQ